MSYNDDNGVVDENEEFKMDDGEMMLNDADMDLDINIDDESFDNEEERYL